MRVPCRILVATATLALVMGANGDNVESGSGPRSADARAARAAYDRALRDAETAFERAAGKAREEYVAVLKSSLDKAMAQRNLDEANRVKAVLEEAQAAAPGDPRGPWLVTWSTGGTWRYEFLRDGLVLDADRAQPIRSTKSWRDGNALLYRFSLAGDAVHVHRYRRCGPYFVPRVA